ncbi:MAG: MmcQ/YjbR family DNA-binding protein [Gulosibacter sp.]|uniref:MmcQ/YjbR family DNA-binding protein n=1 Tax=Gulosibacter sp. TaxID=2817531 RepID=UPI003F908999
MHEQMFDEDDPLLARVRKIALSYPGSDERISHGRPWFFTKTGFAVYGGSVKGDHSVHQQHPAAVLVKADPNERHAWLEDSRFFVPAYFGPSGWVGLDLDGDTDWQLVRELIETSFRLTAPKRLVRELDD